MFDYRVKNGLAPLQWQLTCNISPLLSVDTVVHINRRDPTGIRQSSSSASAPFLRQRVHMHARLRGEMPSLGGGSGRRGLSGGKGEDGARHKRRSICGPINEESETEDSPRTSPTTRLADFDHLSVYKRHHRPRPIIPRSSSTPNLLDILLSDHPIFLNHHPPPSPTLQKHPPSPRLPSSFRSQQQMSNLLPSASLNPRTRITSHIDFRTATTGIIGQSVRNELAHLVSTVKDPQTRKASAQS